MSLPTIHATGRLGADPELRFTPSGIPVCRLRVACDDRRRNPDTGTWETTGTTWLDVSCWRQQAENVADSLTKGDEVLVTGRLRQRSWEADDGTKRTAYEVDADQVAPALGRATVKVARVDRHTQHVRDTHPAPSAAAGGDDPWTQAEPPF